MSLIKIYLKFLKNTPTCFGLRPLSGSYNGLPKITIIMTTAGCFYAKSGDVTACRLYWVILEERLSVRVLASAVDDNSTSEH